MTSTESKASGSAPMVKEQKQKKEKKQKAKKAEAEQSTGASTAPALFAEVKADKDLLDIFGKSAAYILPEPVAVARVAKPKKSAETKAAEKVAAAATDSTLKRKRTGEAASEKKSRKAALAVVAAADEESSDDDDTLEQSYANRKGQAAAGPSKSSAAGDIDMEEAEEEESEEESDVDAALMVHESLLGKNKRNAQTSAPVSEGKKSKKVKSTLEKFTPEGETSGDRDRRTIFVGNLPVQAAKDKHMLRRLQAHLISFAPSAKIESVRFRSVPFAAPTAEMPIDETNPEAKEKEEVRRAKREKERIAAWKASQEEKGLAPDKGKKKRDEEEEKADEAAKVFMIPAEKRKVAFIKKDFHPDMTSVNAYVVFAHPHPNRSANVAPIMNPYEAATEIVEKANGSIFEDRTLRVDSVRLPSAVALSSATTALAKRDAWLPSRIDPKSSCFVGGLDYATKEEDLRAFFESLIAGEKGVKEDGGKYVTSVRIIRDKETQMGKGFGYVSFIDRECVDEVLALDSAKLKFAKRPLRVQPCKSLPPKAPVVHTIPVKAPRAKAGPVPKGDPSLGDKLKDLPKDERKSIKSEDAARQARRLAKKKLRVELEHSLGKDGKARQRAPKDSAKHKKPEKAKKSRVRSENAAKKMKGTRL